MNRGLPNLSEKIGSGSQRAGEWGHRGSGCADESGRVASWKLAEAFQCHVHGSFEWTGSMKILCAVIVALVATQGRAGCYDSDSRAFAAHPRMVELCRAAHCEIVVLSRQCGNIHASSEDYSSEAEHWSFVVRYNDFGTDADDAYFVTYRSLAPGMSSDRRVGGRAERSSSEDVVLEKGSVEQVTCRPITRETACEFVDEVLAKVRKQ